MVGVRAVWVVVVVAVCLGVVLGGVAGAAELRSASGPLEPWVAGNARGQAWAVFDGPQYVGHYVVYRSASGRFGRPFLVPEAAPGFGPGVVINASGAALVVWDSQRGLAASYARAGGVLSRATVVGKGVSGAFALDDRGRSMVVVGRSGQARMRAVFSSRGARFGRPVRLPWAGRPENVFFGPTGTASLYFTDDPAQSSSVVRVAAAPHATSFGDAAAVSAPGALPDLLVSPDRGVHVVGLDVIATTQPCARSWALFVRSVGRFAQATTLPAFSTCFAEFDTPDPPSVTPTGAFLVTLSCPEFRGDLETRVFALGRGTSCSCHDQGSTLRS